MSDPYNDMKIYHKAKLVRDNGDVSPLCATVPKKINMTKETWTTDNSAVTCKKCLAKIQQEQTGVTGRGKGIELEWL